MFNIGFSELVIIAIIAIIFVGPEQLPLFARKLASLLNELKRAKDEILKPVEEFKQEARRAVNKVREEVDTAQLKLDEELRNKVTEILNKEKKNDDSGGTAAIDSSGDKPEATSDKAKSEND